MSERSIALVRAINVAGRRRVTMADLRACCVEVGLADAATYLQSGNVVFSHASGEGERLGAALGARLAEELAPGAEVLVRSADELAAIVSALPFDPSSAPTQLHVTFLAAPPDSDRVAALDTGRAAPDECRLIGRDVYLYCPNGYGRTVLTNSYFERRLKRVATTRNWKTVIALEAMART